MYANTGDMKKRMFEFIAKNIVCPTIIEPVQMDFCKFSRNNRYISNPGKLSKIHWHAWLFTSPWGKVIFLFKSMGQIGPLNFKLLRTFFPGLERNNT